MDATQLKMNGPDIIAIHGITGDYEKTWMVEQGTTRDKLGTQENLIWLRDYLAEDIAEDHHPARIFSYGYEADVTFSKSKAVLDTWATSLLNAIKQKRRKKDAQCRPLIFIFHSMGGLVLKKVCATVP